MTIASELLDQHFSAGERLLSDPAVPAVLKTHLHSLSQLLGREEVMKRVAILMRSRERLTFGPDQKRYLEQVNNAIKALQEHRPDLVKDIAVMTTTGCMAMMLRWPQTAAETLRAAVASQGRIEPARAIKDQTERLVSAASIGAPGAFCPVN